jgi:branched-chain amino acid transport system permease protein
MSDRPAAWIAPTIAAIALLALQPVLSPYLQDLVVKIAIYAVFALSLELLVGVTGLVSLGHAAFLGIGAYVTVFVSGDSGASVAQVLPLAVLAAAGYALFVGALSLRTKGVYFIMVTLAFA